MKQQLFLWIVFFMLTVISSCGKIQNQQEKNNKPTSESTVESNEFSDKILKPITYVNDYENIYTDEQEKILDSLLIAFEKETTIEIVIVTLSNSQTNEFDFDSLTLTIAKKWGVGKKDKNNGVLIGISSSLKRMRIQNGLGIEKIFSDEETKQIIDNVFIPQFKKGEYFEGTRLGVLEIINKLE